MSDPHPPPRGPPGKTRPRRKPCMRGRRPMAAELSEARRKGAEILRKGPATLGRRAYSAVLILYCAIDICHTWGLSEGRLANCLGSSGAGALQDRLAHEASRPGYRLRKSRDRGILGAHGESTREYLGFMEGSQRVSQESQLTSRSR